MSEDNTKSMNGDPTSPLPVEEFVKQQFSVILTRLDKIESEMAERFVQLSRQIRDLDARAAKIEERLEDIDYKLDDFIKEQIRMKREWRDFQESKTS